MKKTLTLFILSIFLVLSAKSQYCTTNLYYNGCNNDYVSSFLTTGGVTNIFNPQSYCGATAGYSYNGNQTHTSIAGATVNFKIINNPQYGENYKIWVDYDNDNTFSTSEEMYSGYIPFGDSVTASFVIPGGTALGTKRLRVRSVRFSAAFTACSQESYGEVEDYNLAIVSSTSCATMPVAGIAQSGYSSVCSSNKFLVSLSGFTAPFGAVIQWQSRPSGNASWTNISGATNANYLVANQTVSTEYRAYIYCATASDTSTLVSVAQNPITQCYCSPNTGNPLAVYSGNYITNVTLSNTTLNYSSSNTPSQGYSLIAPTQSNATATVIPGDYYTLTVSLNYNVLTATAWIDDNANGSFEAAEAIPLAITNTPGGVKGTAGFVLPSTATGGVTGLRVTATSGSSIPNACSQLYSAEVEDYTLNVVTLPACAGKPSAGIVTAPASTCVNNVVVLTVIGSTAASGLTYQWQSKTSSTNWSTIANATNKSHIVASQSAATDYRLIVKCGTNEDTSTTSSVAQSPLAQCYCSPNNGTTLISSPSNYTKQVEIIGTTLNYSSTNTPANGYTLVPSSPSSNTASLNAGFTYQIKTTQSNSWNTEVAVWIDYNANGVFELSERVLLSAADTIATGLLTVPANAVAGAVGMRVLSTNSTVGGACDLYFNGEVEDYTVTLANLPACSGTPSAGVAASTKTTVCVGTPFNLSLSGYSQSSGLSFQWQSKTLPNGNWTNISNATATIWTIPAQNTSTEYRAYVTCGTLSDTSTSVTVNQTPLLQCYCNPSNGTVFTSNGTNLITNVSIPAAGLNYSSTTAPANGHTVVPAANTASMMIGNQYVLSAALSTSNVNVRLYIDFNINGVFENNEMVWGSVNQQQQFNGTINVPSTAVPGTTAMRIIAGQNYFSTPCPVNLQTADVEDYIVTIVAATPCSGQPTAGSIHATAATVCSTDLFSLFLSNTTLNTGLSFQWQSKPTTSSTWTNLQTTTSQYLSNRLQAVATDYRAIVSCGTNADTTAPITIGMSPFNQCYCNPTNSTVFVSSAFNLITNTTIANTTLNSSSTSASANGYTQFPSTTSGNTATLYTGFTYTLQLTLSNLSPQPGVAAWIDYNQDGIYDNATEMIAIPVVTTNSSATFTIPSTALTGATGMRIVIDNYSTVLYSCPYVGEGEIEDYEITIANAPACTGTPVAGTAIATSQSVCQNTPFSLYTANGTIASGLTYQWQSKSIISTAWTNIPGANAGNYTVYNQTATTDYRLVVICNGNADTSMPVTVNQKLFYECYCSPNTGATSILSPYNFVEWAHIPGTTLNSITTVTNLNGYTQYSPGIPSNTATLTAGQAYTFNIELAYQYLYTFFWFDYNRNGTFDNNEYIGFQNTNGDTVAVAFTVPANANTGLTGLRILSTDDMNQVTGSCPTTLNLGEIEDYIVKIDPPCTMPTSLAVTNITVNSADFSWQNANTNYEYVVSQSGTTPTGSGTPVTGTSQSVPGLTSGTPYYFYVRSVCANNTYSPWASLQFTTINTGISDLTLNGNFNVFPNPTTGSATIKYNGSLSKDAVLEIYDVTGKLLRTEKNVQDNTEINIAGLASGLYILKLKDNEASATLRLTKE